MFPALPVNPSAFQVVDSHQKAYLIGFLLADGCVREGTGNHQSRVVLRILAADLKVCRMVQEIAGGNLRYIEDGYRIEWDVTSDAIAADLTALGITPRKTFTASLRWDLVPDHLHGAVLAGLIDGDGHMRYKPKQRQAEISVLTASIVLKAQLCRLFPFFEMAVIPIRGGRKHILYNLLVESNRARLNALIQTVYDPLPFGILDRKQAVLDAIRGYLAAQEDYDRMMAEAPRLRAAGLTAGEIAASFGVNRNTVGKHLRTQGIDSRRVVFTDQDRQEMQRLHGQGLTVLQVHAAIGKGTEQAVRFHLQRMGCLTKTPLPRTRHKDADAVLGMHGEGHPVYRISAEVGIGVKLISRILADEGFILESGSPQKLTRDQVLWADAEIANGRTLSAVAAELGVSGTLVRTRRKQLAEESASRYPREIHFQDRFR